MNSEETHVEDWPLVLKQDDWKSEKSFQSIPEFLSWITEEQDAWRPLLGQVGLKGRYEGATNELRKARDEKDIKTARRASKSLLSKPLPTTEGRFGGIILQTLREDRPEEPSTTGKFAACAQLKYFVEGQVDGQIAVLEMLIKYYGLQDMAELRQQVEKASHPIFQQGEKLRGLYEEATREAKDLHQQTYDTYKENKKSFDKLFSESETALKALKKTYEEQIALQVPVKYWEDRAEDFKGKWCKFYGLWWVLVGGAIGGAVLFAVWWCSHGETAQAAANANFTSFSGFLNWLKVDGLSFFPLTVTSLAVVWYLRVTTRLFLTNVHLYNDARERKVIAETFLALSDHFDTRPGQRDIFGESIKFLLPQLFRKAADGTMKDDGIPAVVGIFNDGKTT